MTELLIVGGLTIDRFADGTTAPGGSVIHAGRAAAAQGADVRILTVAGDEPGARAGLAALDGFARVMVQPSAATTTYRHEEAEGRRVLVYEAASDRIDPTVADELAPVDVLLVAPIAHELSADAIAQLGVATGARLVVLLIQGWLRHLRLGAPVGPMSIGDVTARLWSALGQADAVVVSVEDYAGAPDDPFAQAAVLRSHLGPRPVLVVTLGPEGYVLDDPAANRIVAALPRRVVTGTPTVGAGDTFGAAMALRLAAGGTALDAAEAGTEAVISLFESRLA